jgi:hypothetical protein
VQGSRDRRRWVTYRHGLTLPHLISYPESPDLDGDLRLRTLIPYTTWRDAIQLELSSAQRAAFFKDGDMTTANRSNVTEDFNRYVEAVQVAYRRLRA